MYLAMRIFKFIFEMQIPVCERKTFEHFLNTADVMKSSKPLSISICDCLKWFDSGVTVEEEIDGWRDGEGGGAVKDAKRLDYIFCNTQKKVKSSKVVCNGKNYPVVSDHYGVMIEVED